MNLFLSFIRDQFQVPPNELEKLSSYLSSKSLKKNEFLLNQGEQAKDLSFIVKGMTRMYCIDIDGKEHTKALNFEDSFIAGYTSLLTQKPCVHYIQCLEDSEFITIDYLQWKKNFKDNPWPQIELQAIQQDFLSKERREHLLLTKNAADRYYDFVDQYRDQINRIPDKYVASYLGITPTSFSRLKKQTLNTKS